MEQVWRGYVGHTHTHALDVRAHAHVHVHACTRGRPGWRRPTAPRRRCGTRSLLSASSRPRTAARTPADMCACACVHMCTRTRTAAQTPVCARAHMNTNACAHVARAGKCDCESTHATYLLARVDTSMRGRLHVNARCYIHVLLYPSIPRPPPETRVCAYVHMCIRAYVHTCICACACACACRSRRVNSRRESAVHTCARARVCMGVGSGL